MKFDESLCLNVCKALIECVNINKKELIGKTEKIFFLSTMIRRSQDSLFTNSCIELFLFFFFPLVSIVKEKHFIKKNIF